MQEKQSPQSGLLIITLLSSILILSDLVGMMAWYKNIRAYIGLPLITFASNAQKAVSESFASAFHGTTLKHENLALRQRILDLESTLFTFQAKEKTETSLKNFYETTTQSLYSSTVDVQILDQNAGKLPGRLLLNKGGKDGIKAGMPVVYGKYYVGYISSATEFDSICTSYTIPGQEFVGYVPGRKITGIVHTTVNDIDLSDLLASEQVSLHDVVAIKRDGFPYLFTLGTISKIPLNNGSAERKALITGSINANDLNFVTVVKK